MVRDAYSADGQQPSDETDSNNTQGLPLDIRGHTANLTQELAQLLAASIAQGQTCQRAGTPTGRTRKPGGARFGIPEPARHGAVIQGRPIVTLLYAAAEGIVGTGRPAHRTSSRRRAHADPVDVAAA